MFEKVSMLVLGSLLCLPVFGQTLGQVNPATSNGQSLSFIPPSPNAGSLGIYGQVPVGNFTGTASIQVPIYEISYKNFKLPIGLTYHASGHRPDLFPSEVGLGWALQAGGVITRVVKGVPDYEYYPVASTVPLKVVDAPTNGDNWFSTAKLDSLLKGYLDPDDDSNPDEYYFEMGGVSGKFYFGHDTAYHLKSSDNRFFSIKGELVTNKKFKMPTLAQRPDWPYTVTYSDTLRKDRLTYRFTLTDGSGIKYVFGGTDNSIEFTRPGYRSGESLAPLMHSMITPCSWYLTSIEFPNGERITLDYKRQTYHTKVGVNFIERCEWLEQGSTVPYISGGLTSFVKHQKTILTNGSYLSSITTPKEIINFTHSEASNQLRFPIDSTLIFPNQITNQNLFILYTDVHNAWIEKLYPLKLDEIVIRDRNNKTFRRAELIYTNDTTTRLKLLTANIYGNNNIGPQAYSFEYNPLSLPPYLSNKTDHYGFYNGRNPYITSTDRTPFYTLDSAAFWNSKEVDTNYIQAEMLTKIVYPTKGYTTFEFERHDYSSYVTTWPFAVNQNPLSANKLVGGLRVKKVTSYDGTGAVSSTKNYYYRKNYKDNGTVSSGVKAFTPTYTERLNGTVTPPARKNWSSVYTGSLTYYQWSSNPIFPMGMTRGNHVTYSEVAEVNADGGFTIYKYKNYDNGYNDQQPLNFVSDNTPIKQFWKEDEGISMDLERGQLLSEEIYDASKIIKAKKIFKYNDDPNRFSKNIRVINQTPNSIVLATIPSFRMIATLVYTYFPYLKEENSYLYGASNDSIVATLKYTYDTTYRLQKSTEITNSDGKVHKMIYRYPHDMLSSPNGTTYSKMFTRQMVNFLVERERQEDNVKLATDIVDYGEGLSFNSSLIFPSAVRTQYMSQTPETKVSVNLYDSTDNALMTTTSAGAAGNGIRKSYIWSYNNQHAVAVIENATFSTVEAALGGRAAIVAFGRSMPTDAALHSFLAPLRTNPTLSVALVNTYTYDPLVGMTSMTDANNRRSYYEYDNFGRLYVVRDHDSLIIKTICYNYAGQVEDCNKGGANNRQMDLKGASTPAEICSPAVGWTSTVYMARNELNYTPGSPINGSRTFYYTNPGLTSPLSTGYYAIKPSPGNSVFTYWYVENGRHIYTNICGYPPPKMLKYSSTTFTNICATNLQEAPVFGNIILGDTLFSEGPNFNPVQNGFYQYNDSIFHTYNGKIMTMVPCENIIPVTRTELRQLSLLPPFTCSNGGIVACYHFQPLQVGTYLFIGVDLLTKRPFGTYSDGVNKYSVTGGKITSVTPCL